MRTPEQIADAIYAEYGNQRDTLILAPERYKADLVDAAREAQREYEAAYNAGSTIRTTDAERAARYLRAIALGHKNDGTKPRNEAEKARHWGIVRKLEWAAGLLEHGSTDTEPQFAPEGEPDGRRDQWQQIEREPAGLTLTIEGATTAVGARVSHKQARHILAYLSEQSRRAQA